MPLKFFRPTRENEILIDTENDLPGGCIYQHNGQWFFDGTESDDSLSVTDLKELIEYMERLQAQ